MSSRRTRRRNFVDDEAADDDGNEEDGDDESEPSQYGGSWIVDDSDSSSFIPTQDSLQVIEYSPVNSPEPNNQEADTPDDDDTPASPGNVIDETINLISDSPVATSTPRRSSREMDQAEENEMKPEKKIRSSGNSQVATTSGSKTPSKTSLDTSGGDDGNTCTICFGPWTSTGPHRLVSLNCGHLYGKECIERWIDTLKKPAKPHCPHCKQAAKKKDIRPIFARTIRSVDTSEKDDLEKKVKKLESKRMSLEKQLAESKSKYLQSQDIISDLKKKLSDAELKYVLLLSNTRRSNIESSSVPSSMNSYLNSSSPSSSKKDNNQIRRSRSTFHGIKSLEVSKDGNCRVLAGSKHLSIITVSMPTINPMFPGFGIKRINLDGYKQNEYIKIHSKPIKDMIFKDSEPILLSTSWDKTLKLTSMITKKVILDINLDMDGWSCCWSPCDNHLCYVGLKNGQVSEYDIRNISSFGPVRSFMNSSLSSCPLISLQYVHCDNKSVPRGLLCTSLKSAHFIPITNSGADNSSSDNEILLPFFGSLTSGQFDSGSGYGLISIRPDAERKNVTHNIFEMTTNELGEPSAEIVKTFQGGKSAIKMARSKIFRDPSGLDESDSFLFGADESAGGIKIWDIKTRNEIQVIKTPKCSPVLDIELVQDSDNSMAICALTDSTLNIYKRSLS